MATPTTNDKREMEARAQNASLDGRTTTEIAIDMGGCERETARPLRDGRCRDQILPKTSEPLVPPNPKEFLTATLIGISRAVLAQ